MKKLSLLMALILIFLSITGCSNQLAIKDLNFEISEENIEKFLSGVFKEIDGYDVELSNIDISHDVDSYKFMQACVKLQTNGLEKDSFYIDFYPKRNSGSTKLYYIELSSGYFRSETDSEYLGFKILIEAIEKHLSQESKFKEKVHTIPSFSYGFDYEKSKVSYYLQDNKYECTIRGRDTMGYVGYTFRIKDSSIS